MSRKIWIAIEEIYNADADENAETASLYWGEVEGEDYDIRLSATMTCPLVEAWQIWDAAYRLSSGSPYAGELVDMPAAMPLALMEEEEYIQDPSTNPLFVQTEMEF